MFDESYTYYGEDLDINCRLALAGCKFASVDRALNYRRYSFEKGHKKSSFISRWTNFDHYIKLFDDLRFPEDLLPYQG